jgi:hypothetical protein
MSISISAKVTECFFDRPTVMEALDKATRKALSRFGAFVRQTAQKSLQERSAHIHARPGGPPFVHSSAKLLKIRAGLRSVNRARKKAGQTKLKPRGMFSGLKYILFAYDTSAKSVVIGPASNRVRGVTIPEILEEGKLGIPARPFMGPAFDREKSKAASLWAGSVRP